jgi:hypothetical protein
MRSSFKTVPSEAEFILVILHNSFYKYKYYMLFYNTNNPLFYNIQTFFVQSKSITNILWTHHLSVMPFTPESCVRIWHVLYGDLLLKMSEPNDRF